MAISEKTVIEVWEDFVGDSGKEPTERELVTFATALRDYILDPLILTGDETV